MFSECQVLSRHVFSRAFSELRWMRFPWAVPRMGSHPPSPSVFWSSLLPVRCILQGQADSGGWDGSSTVPYGLLSHDLGGPRGTGTIRGWGNIAEPHFPPSRTAGLPLCHTCLGVRERWVLLTAPILHFSAVLLIHSPPDIPLVCELSYLFSIISKTIIQ